MLDIMILDNDGNSIDHLTQWDYNQTLVISGDGLDVAKLSQVHFCNKNSKTAYCVATNVVDGNITAIIPNALLIEPYPILAYVWYQDGDAGRTQYALTIPIRKRTKPDDFEYENNSSIIDLIQLKTDVEGLQEAFETFTTTYTSTSQYGLVKISSSGAISVSSGVIGVNTNASYGIQKVNNYIAISPATDSEIAAKSNTYKPIVPATLKKAVETIGGALTSLNTTEKTSYVGAINEVLRDTKYTNNSPTPTSIGGIDAGTTFNNKSIKDILTDLLYPYVEFYLNGGSTTYTEYGTTTTLSSISITVYKGSEDITSLSITSGGSSIATAANITTALNTINAASSEESVTVEIPITFTSSATSDSLIVASMTDANNITQTQTIKTYKPTCPIYYGVLNSISDITASAISGLTKVAALSSTRGTKTYSYTCNNQVPVIAYPKSYELLSTITDPNNFNVTGDFLYTEVTMNINGNSIVYYVYYLSGQTTCTNFNYKFSF